MLVCYWYPALMMSVRFKPSSHEESDYLLIEDAHGTQTLKEIFGTHNEGEIGSLVRRTVSYLLLNSKTVIFSKFQRYGTLEKVDSIRFFTYRKIRYIWYEKDNEWLNPADLDSTVGRFLGCTE